MHVRERVLVRTLFIYFSFAQIQDLMKNIEQGEDAALFKCSDSADAFSSELTAFCKADPKYVNHKK